MIWVEEAGYRETMEKTVEPALAEIRREVMLPVRDGRLHVEIYEPRQARAALLLLHGYTESAEKFREMIWYFTQAGFAVYAPDQRGHGCSTRLTEDTSVTDVEHFEDYVDDAEKILDEWIQPEKTGKRSVLYAHSMGGAVAGFLLMRRPGAFERAVLTAPMIAPSSAPLPKWAGGAVAGLMCRLGKAKERAFIGKPYDAASETFETSFATSRARFAYYAKKRAENRLLQNCSPTYRWAREAAGVTRGLLDKRNLQKITTPVLLIQAQRDTVVLLPEQQRFVDGLKDGKLVRCDAKHEIYLSEDGVLQPYVTGILDFLG